MEGLARSCLAERAGVDPRRKVARPRRAGPPRQYRADSVCGEKRGDEVAVACCRRRRSDGVQSRRRRTLDVTSALNVVCLEAVGNVPARATPRASTLGLAFSLGRRRRRRRRPSCIDRRPTTPLLHVSAGLLPAALQ